MSAGSGRGTSRQDLRGVVLEGSHRRNGDCAGGATVQSLYRDSADTTVPALGAFGHSIGLKTEAIRSFQDSAEKASL